MNDKRYEVESLVVSPLGYVYLHGKDGKCVILGVLDGKKGKLRGITENMSNEIDNTFPRSELLKEG